MKKTFTIFLIAICTLTFGQDFEWVKDLAETNPNINGTDPNGFEIVDVEVDASGFVYVLGNFKGTVDVAPGAASLNLTSLGGIDLFLIKYNATGDVIQTFISANNGALSNINSDEVAKDMVLSSDGYLYLTGYYESDYYFWPYWQDSDVTLNCDCSHNMFVAKINTTSFYVEWAKEPFSCIADMDYEYISGEKITIKNETEIYVGGHFYGYPAIVSGTSFNSTDPKDDVFFAKIDNNGVYAWGKEIKSTASNQEYITGIAAGSYLYVTGYFDDDASIDMDPTTGSSLLTSNGYTDIFLGMYSAVSGAYYSATYVGNIGGSLYDYSNSIDVDGSNNVYLSGYTTNSSDIDIKTGVQNVTGGFIVQYNSLLSYSWSINLGLYTTAVAKIDANNNIVANGKYKGTVNFNPRGTAYNLASTSPSYYNLFLGKYNSSGQVITMKTIGGSKHMANDATAAFNNLFLLGCSKESTDFVIYGKYEEVVDFDAGDGISLSSPSTYQNGRYLARYSHCAPTTINSQTATDQYLCEGDNLSMFVNSSGNNLTYQWYIDGDPIADGFHAFGNITGSETNLLRINEITPSAVGMPYNCNILSSCADPIYSNTLDVFVDRLPVINSNPENITQCQGSNVNFTVGTQYATGFQWLVNDGSGSFQALSDDSQYSGTQTATLTINNIQPDQSYYQYKCFVTGACPPELYSSPATLIVNPDPNIQTQPVNTSVCQGSSTTFSISTNGGGLTFQWQVSTNGGGTFNNISNGTYYSGTQTSTLNILNALVSYNNYEYRCVVSGSCGAPINSNSAILTVNELTVLSSQPIAVEACEYTDITYSVNASGYNLNYRWQVNDGGGWVNLNNGGSYSNVTNSSMDISYINSALSGNQYRCLLTSGCSANIYSNSADLTVSQAPLVTVSSSDGLDICQGTNTLLTIAGGDVSYIYQWKKNYATIGGQNQDNLLVTQTGTYSIYAENSIGCSSESEPITINVHALPIAAITVIGNSEFCEGGYAELIAPSGNGNTYQWYNNSTLIGGAISNSYIVTENGNFHIEVTNTYGCNSTSPSETIIVNPLPTVSLNPSSNIEICQGSSSTISATNNPFYFYQWKENNLNISSANSPDLIVNANGMYNVSVINTNTGCNYTSEYVSVIVNALPNPVIQASGDLVYCVQDHIDLSLNEVYTNYLWDDNSENSTLLVDASGNYNVTVTDINGCQNSSSIQIEENLVQTPNICMVTVDTTSNKNLIVWENIPGVNGIASYNIYKLINSTYQLLGNVLYNDTTEFVDLTSEPSLHSDQYAIASVDSCGNIGAYSPFHQTMNLSIVDGTGSSIALIWTKYIDESGINNPTEYEIYRGVGNWSYYTSITGGLSDYNYNIPSFLNDERFIIVVQRPYGCAPLNGNKATGGPYYQSVSNVEDEGIIATQLSKIENTEFSIFPNPFDRYTIIKSNTSINQIRLFSITGELLKTISNLNTKEYQFNRDEFAKGTYLIEINGFRHMKLIIE